MSLLGSLPTKTTRGSRNQDEEDERGSRRAKRRRYKLLEDNWGEEEQKSGMEEGFSTIPTPDIILLPHQEPEEQEAGLLSGILRPGPEKEGMPRVASRQSSILDFLSTIPANIGRTTTSTHSPT